MPQMLGTIAFPIMLVLGTHAVPAHAAEREQARMVINLIAGVKMPFPQNLRNNRAEGTSSTRYQQRDRGLPSSRMVGPVVG